MQKTGVKSVQFIKFSNKYSQITAQASSDTHDRAVELTGKTRTPRGANGKNWRGF